MRKILFPISGNGFFYGRKNVYRNLIFKIAAKRHKKHKNFSVAPAARATRAVNQYLNNKEPHIKCPIDEKCC